MPSIHPMVKIAPEGVALHTEEFARWAGSEDGIRGLNDATAGLAQVIIDLVSDPRLLPAAREEFERAGGEMRVERATS